MGAVILFARFERHELLALIGRIADGPHFFDLVPLVVFPEYRPRSGIERHLIAWSE
jgi:hypothetical protein